MVSSDRQGPSCPTPPEDHPVHGWRLTPKLILSLTVIVVVVLGTSAWFGVIVIERQFRREVVLGADQLSKTIVSATWHAMLADRREAAYETMRVIGRQEGIDKIRIFNKEGRVMFSTGTETGTMVDKKAEACDLCHDTQKPLLQVALPSRSRVYAAPGGGRMLGLVTPIYNEPSCSNALCHAHPEDLRVLGVLDVSLSLDRVDRDIAVTRWRAIITALVLILLTGAFIALFVRRFVGRPIEGLIQGTRAVSAMDLGQDIKVGTGDEIGELSHSFNLMRLRLKKALAEIHEFTQSLEKKAEERTRQLQAARESLTRKDRLASLGQLSASMAHEINNPLSGVLNYAMLMDRVVERNGIPPGRVEEFRGYLRQVIEETSRVGRIVSELLSFSRQSRPQITPQDFNELVRKTLTLAGPRLEQSRIETHFDLDSSLPPVPCDGPQIKQVVLNLVMNAAEAMPSGGTLSLRTHLGNTSETVVLEVEDTGTGIREDLLPRVFDPFFTTKEEGKGVGLGLAVVFGIIDAHGGSIDLKSTVNRGTLAVVSLPLVYAEHLPSGFEERESNDDHAL